MLGPYEQVIDPICTLKLHGVLRVLERRRLFAAYLVRRATENISGTTPKGMDLIGGLA